MLDDLRWKYGPILVLCIAIVFLIRYMILGVNILGGLTVFLMAIFFSTLVMFLIISLISGRLGEPSFFDGLFDNSLVTQVYKQQSMVAWTVAVAFVEFVSVTILIGIALFQVPVELTRSFAQTTAIYFVISFIIFIFGLVLLFLARIKAEPRLSSKLATIITPELIAKHPQAAIEHSFTIFEDHLRQKVGAGPELFGKNLINQAYGEKGVLQFGDLPGEQIGIRNLMDGVYSTFRNPRKHRIINDDEQTVRAIILLLDLMIKLVDESQ